MLPLVSIICNTYNHEKYIAQCIQGFLMQQTNFEFEILIHDDASTDGTQNIIRKFALVKPDVMLPILQTVNQYQLGINNWLEYQFPRARGKYIALCEGDDYWTDPYKLQKQVDFLEGNPEYSACFHNANVVDSNGKPIRVFHSERLKSSFDFEAIIQGWFVPTASLLFRNNSSIVESMKSMIPGIISGDRLLLALIGSKGLIGYIDQNMSAYRKHEGGISSWGHRLTIFKSNVTLFKKLHKHFYPKYNKVITNQIFRWQGNLCNEYWKNKSFFYFAMQVLKTILYVRSMNDLKALFKVYLFQKNP